MNLSSLSAQLLAIAVAVGAAPLLVGWISQCRAWMQNRSGAGILQPYRMLHKLFNKDVVLAHNASSLFRLAPYVQFGAMVSAAAVIPSLGTELPFSTAADTIVLVGLFAVARVFTALAAMDIGAAFGTLGARREMLIGFLAEPALLMVFFTASLITGSTSLPTLVSNMIHLPLALHPGLAFAAVAFLMVLLAENARIPVDNPTTHLELTMIHEATALEYSARHLALVEWAASLKLFNYCCIGLALFLPWGLDVGHPAGLMLALPLTTLKLAVAGAGIALIETLSAKLRIFRAPEFLATAFLLAVLGLLMHLQQGG